MLSSLSVPTLSVSACGDLAAPGGLRIRNQRETVRYYRSNLPRDTRRLESPGFSRGEDVNVVGTSGVLASNNAE